MKTHSARGTLVAGALVAVAIALATTVVGARQTPGSAPQTPASAAAVALCAHWKVGGPPVAVAGPQLKWYGRRADTEVASFGLQLVQLAQSSGLLIAGRGPWVVVGDRSQSRAIKMNCGNGQYNDVALRPDVFSIDVSDTGAVALLGVEGLTLVPAALEKDGKKSQPLVIQQPHIGAAGDVAWFFEQVMYFGPLSVTRINISGPSAYETATVPLDGPTGAVQSAFWHNGLAYVQRNACVDLFVRPAVPQQIISHELSRAACSAVPVSYLIAAQRQLIGVSPAGQQVWSAGRPTVASATFSGNMFEIMSAVSALAAAPWVGTPPLPLGGSPPSSTMTKRSPDWEALLPRERWSSEAAFQSGMRRIVERGWGINATFRKERESLTGSGISARWENDLGRIKPNGRTLTDIAKEVYAEGTFSDSQVNAIWSGSGALADTLEGRLYSEGWLPASLSSKQPRAVAFTLPTSAGRTEVQHVDGVWTGQSPRSFAQYRCTRSATRPDEKLSIALRRGVKIAGGFGQLSNAVKATEGADIMAQELAIVDCEAPGLARTSLLVAENTLIQTSQAQDTPSAKSAIRWPNTLNVQAVAGSDTEWLVRSPLVIGTRSDGFTKDDWDIKVVRPLADRVVTGHQLELLVPVTQLEVAVVVPQDWERAFSPIPNSSIGSAESSAAATRGSVADCDANSRATHRSSHESIAGMTSRTGANRTVKRVLGLAENALKRDHKMFMTDADGTVWAVPAKLVSDFDQFDLKNPPPVDSRMSTDDKDIAHGTRVAGLLVGQVDLRGLLDVGSLAWVNTNDSYTESQGSLDLLAERRSIVNVSVGFTNDTWGKQVGTGLRTPTYEQGLLLIAAAANLENAGVHGAPITWKMANVVGVGGVDEKKQIPTGAAYVRADIDLLAPGMSVPLHKVGDGMECLDGTSYATAHVTAVAALLLEKMSPGSPSSIRARLLSTADWRSTYAGQVKGGLVNATRALEFLDNNVVTVQPTPTSKQERLIADLPLVSTESFQVFVDDGSAATPRIQWRRLLRLHRVDDAPDQTARYRVVYVTDNKQLEIHDKVSIAASVVAPFTNCRTLMGGAAGCQKMPIGRIQDYVSSLYTGTINKF